MASNNYVEWQTLLDKITFEAPIHLLEEVKNAKSLQCKIDICYKTSNIYATLSDWLSLCIKRPSGTKNSELSAKHRQVGNGFCEEQKFALALHYYNQSLIYALKDSDEQRSAFGNRSHVLLLMNQFEDSIKDVDKALSNDTSVLRRIKLSIRKGECLLALKRYSEATKILSETSSLIRSLDSNIKKKTLKTLQQVEQLLTIANEEVKRFKSDANVNSTEQAKSLDLKLPVLNFKENPEFHYASKSISLRKNELKGRFVIANDEIKVGDILFVERPFAFVVLPKMVHKYCSFCCKRIFALVPCSKCSLACFCNEECRDAAWKSFHSWECGGLEVCFSVGIVHLSLRVALLGLLKENTEDYLEVKNLVSHLNDLQSSDLFSYTVTATLLVIYLEKYTGLFEGEGRLDKLLEFGGTVLLHIGQLVCNGHAITDIESEELNPKQSVLIEDQVRVGTAIYPSASMMNHSCEPNIINSFFNSLLIVRSTKDLQEGDEIYNCYGPMVYNTDYNKRQELLLSQYFFVCDCNSCKNKDGPVTDTLVCKHCSSKLKIESSSCYNCSKTIDMQSLIKELNDSDCAFKEGMEKLENNEMKEHIQLLLKALSLREKHCHKYHRKLLECRDFLARAYAELGKEEESYHLIVKNISAIEGIYGKFSVELGQEIMKLMSIITSLCDKNVQLSPKQRKIVKESIEFGEKGFMIFTLSYGDWHPRFAEMKKHLDYIKFVLNT